MTITKRATIKSPVGLIVEMALFRVESKCYRWIETLSGQRSDDIDYLSESDAIRGLRVWADTDPSAVGYDLTIIPVAPPPEERAAKRILRELQGEISVDEIAEIIRNETGLAAMIESSNLLLAYLIRNLHQPKPPGLDVTQAGLILEVIVALERAQATDLPNLKKRLTETPSEIKIVGSAPGLIQ